MKPSRGFEVVIIVLEGRAGVVGRVDKHTFHQPTVVGQQRFERGQGVAMDEQVLGIRVTVGYLFYFEPCLQISFPGLFLSIHQTIRP